MRVFDDEFDYREVENWAELICYYFAVAMALLTFLNVPIYTSGGGGGSDNELPKKRDGLDEELERVRRCANTAKSGYRIVRESG